MEYGRGHGHRQHEIGAKSVIAMTSADGGKRMEKESPIMDNEDEI